MDDLERLVVPCMAADPVLAVPALTFVIRHSSFVPDREPCS
jgi:hypothetical protein